MDGKRLIVRESRTYAWKKLKAQFRKWLAPQVFQRYTETGVLIDLSGILARGEAPQRVLDIGSPQILSQALAAALPRTEFVYINPFAPELEQMRDRVAVMRCRNLEVIDADIRDLTLAERLGRFDYIFSCSVFEHIYPEDGGDAQGARNLDSLLHEGGVFCFSVPFAKNGFHEYIESPAYADMSEGSDVCFFQRLYDWEALQRQIYEPSGLALEEEVFLGERIRHLRQVMFGRCQRLTSIFSLNRFSVLLGRQFPWLESLFLERSSEAEALKRPYLAFARLRKASTPTAETSIACTGQGD